MKHLKSEKAMQNNRKEFIQDQQEKISLMLLSLMRYTIHGDEKERERLENDFHLLNEAVALVELKSISAIESECETLLSTLKNKNKISDAALGKLFRGLAQAYEKIEKLYNPLQNGNEEKCIQPAVPSQRSGQSEYINMIYTANILIVDSDLAVLEVLEEAFRKEGYDVVGIADPHNIFPIINEKKIKAILLEPILVKQNGLEVLVHLRKQGLDIPVFFLSAQDAVEDKVEALKAGAEDYITKPFHTKEVVARVERCLQRLAHERYKVILNRDTLTGAYTRRYFNERLQEAKEWLIRKGEVFSVVFLDIDYFKNINDTYGHLIGDYVLKEFANLAKKNLRATDQIYRFGGDEFVFLMPRTTAEEAYQVVERFRNYIQENPIYYEYEDKKINISISISAGIVAAEDKNEPLICVLEKADKALYYSKEEGRNQVMLATDEMVRLKRKKRILLVDDTRLIVQMIKMRLLTMDYEISEAYDGEEGIQKSKEIRPDLMIVDLIMPKLDGFEVCRQVKNNPETRNTKIIILSSSNQEENIVKSFEIGADDYVTKPFSLLELERRIRRLLK